MEYDQLTIGDDVLIRLTTGLDRRAFGSGWRIGTITAIGFDALHAEPVVELDDGGPGIYLGHISHVSVLTRSRTR